MSGREKLQSLKRPRACPQLCGNLTLCETVKEIYTFYADESWVWTTQSRNDFRKKKTREKLLQWALQLSSWSMLTRKSPRNVELGLVSTPWNFTYLTTLWRVCNVKGTMTWSTRSNPRVNMAYMFKNGNILEFLMSYRLAYVHVYYQW